MNAIRFDRECFEIAGYQTVYIVNLMAPRYPVRFNKLEDAEAFARKRNRPVLVKQEPIYRRIKQ